MVLAAVPIKSQWPSACTMLVAKYYHESRVSSNGNVIKRHGSRHVGGRQSKIGAKIESAQTELTGTAKRCCTRTARSWSDVQKGVIGEFRTARNSPIAQFAHNHTSTNLRSRVRLRLRRMIAPRDYARAFVLFALASERARVCFSYKTFSFVRFSSQCFCARECSSARVRLRRHKRQQSTR